MKFEMWSIWHILMIICPFILTGIIYYFVRKRAQKAKDILALILGIISIAILVVRNIDILINYNDYFEVIPFQVCHLGNIIAGLALITKKRWLLLTSFCFNLIPAYCAIVFAGALSTDFETIWQLRPQTYIWGHIIIVVCALYGILAYKPKIEKKDIIISVSFIGVALVNGAIWNSVFRELFNWDPNYFFLHNAEYTPFGFIYNAFSMSYYGWFEINWFYAIIISILFMIDFVSMFFLYKLLQKKVLKQTK